MQARSILAYFALASALASSTAVKAMATSPSVESGAIILNGK